MTVVPDTFELVDFEASQIQDVYDDMVGRVPGLPDGLVAEIQVDEQVPTARIGVTSIEPLVLAMESGAFENTKQPRSFGVEASENSLGRLLFEVADRLSDDFGAPPLDEELELAERVAWNTYCFGRLSRLGVRVYKPKHIYNFRNRHGFSDAADATFEKLWSAESLTWSDIKALC